MKYNYVDFNKITYTGMISHDNLQFYKIKYDKRDFIFEICNIMYISHIDNSDEVHKNSYVIKLLLDDISFINFIKIINEKIIVHMLHNRPTMFNAEFTDEGIRNLFFSNLEMIDNKTFLNLKSRSISFIHSNTPIKIHIVGVWIYNNTYGITFEYYNP